MPKIIKLLETNREIRPTSIKKLYEYLKNIYSYNEIEYYKLDFEELSKNIGYKKSTIKQCFTGMKHEKLFEIIDKRLNRKRQWTSKYQKGSKEHKKELQVRSKYGINLNEYNVLFEKQNGKCAICEIKKDVLHIDHCHKTGEVRGLLCVNCNLALGNFKDNVKILQKAINYLAL